MKDYPRLIEHAFPLRQASIDSVHEKMCHQGHIKGIHIWPARRPLAAARAALLATLLPDPGTPQGRKELCEKIGGKLSTETDKEGRLKEVTNGGVLRWGREIENKATLDWFSEEIRKANGGTPPKILDPFSGGGAIPFEAMRLGCESTAMDINPVAWFILKCTMDYPQKLAGQKQSLPDFILRDVVFMEEYFTKAHGLKGARLRKAMEGIGHKRKGVLVQDESDFGERLGEPLNADLSWHVRAWGRKLLGNTREKLGHLYPTYADWQPLIPGKPFESRAMRLIELDDYGIANVEKLNTELSEEYLRDQTNPRWVAKPTLAYLWARTATCKNCRATIPLVTSSWLYKKGNNRIRLVMRANSERTAVLFSIEHHVPERGGNAAQKREYDKKIGAGTMSKAGAQCPCCSTAEKPIIMSKEDLRYESRNRRLGQCLTAVLVEGQRGKEYRLPTDHERSVADIDQVTLNNAYSELPFGIPNEPTPRAGPGASRAFSLDQYGFDQWGQIFFRRQLVTIGTLGCGIRRFRDELVEAQYPQTWVEAISAYLACSLDKVADYNSALVPWQTKSGKGSNTFNRWALPMKWDVVENAILDSDSGGFLAVLDWISCPLNDTLFPAADGKPAPVVIRGSSISAVKGEYDAIITDPPYYDAIPYSDLMDFFHVWLRRVVGDLSQEYVEAFHNSLGPKWDDSSLDGELIDDASRHQKDKKLSKQIYEDGMAKVFYSCHAHLKQTGRFVVVFANKQPDAWETLVSAIIRAGFVVDGSWPIATEMANRTRAMASAALASSVWLVCRKRDPLAKVGWDNRVISEMRENIAGQLREFWDAGIRGPDFVWAATGPAMEAFSKFPAVKKTNSPTNEFLTVREFLEAVRRIVIEFVVGRVLHIESETDRLDSVTSYYLLHRNDFGFDKAPAGACIMYAVSCGLSDAELERTWNLVKVKGSTALDSSDVEEADDDDSKEQTQEMSGGEFLLRTWKERKENRMGFESVGGREIPLIDRVHRLMHLWRDGDVRKVDNYIDECALRQNELFGRLVQSLIELSEQASEERSILESLSNHLMSKASKAEMTRSLGLDLQTEN